ncbi:MAG: right-handed parallel beta-helix repeat-containing protein [Bacteroidales bacterium]|nr:right-handed parallel beta-helix repeat-containing protein [Bacteroidales bacterium]
MKKAGLFLVFMGLISMMSSGQTYIPITDNMQIQSNSNIKFIAGEYSFSDAPADGVIQLNNVHDVILDGDSCYVNGLNDQGYMIKIINSDHVVIKNFDSVHDYFYAVHIMNSHHITINGNVFSGNKVDSSGWISIWTDYTQALGGGVLIYQSRSANIYENTMTLQNDGVALYHCDSIRVSENDFSWNTSFGIRMYWTDTCHIYQNNCSHVNRPYTDPSDCAALLMLVSNENVVEYNDLSYSGDGVFLGQYQHSNIPNNNYFGYNECSYSPHNAIEATFADGNTYLHNNCNYSHYGFWLGYSFNTLVDSNEIIGNFQSGIAIDRGFENTITGNIIQDNPTGIELWEGSPITGYSNQYSHDYFIHNNLFDGNTLALSASKTEHLVAIGNAFDFSRDASIFFDGQSDLDTISGNTFRFPTVFHISNNSSYGIYAIDNTWIPGDTSLISEKIFDKYDNPAKGEVHWWPVQPSPEVAAQVEPPCDMAEPPSTWYGYPETGYPAPVKFADSLYFDTEDKMVGEASVKFVTSRGWYVALNYRPSGDSLSVWGLNDEDTLYFWVKTLKFIPYGFQYFQVRIGDREGNYIRYSASANLLNQAHEVWKRYQFPLAGNTTFQRSAVGDMNWNQVNYLEFWADTWDYGFTLWLDGVQFSECDPVTAVSGEPQLSSGLEQNYPNPFINSTTIRFGLTERGHVTLSVTDLFGNVITTLVDQIKDPGEYIVRFHAGDLPAGIYFCYLCTNQRVLVKKMIILD